MADVLIDADGLRRMSDELLRMGEEIAGWERAYDYKSRILRVVVQRLLRHELGRMPSHDEIDRYISYLWEELGEVLSNQEYEGEDD